MNDAFHTSAKTVVRNEHDELLLIEYQDLGEVGFHYNLPGGRIRKDELASEAAVRKCLEEAGLAIESPRFLFVYEYIGARFGDYGTNKHSIGIVFTAEVDSSRTVLQPPKKPDLIQTGVRWVPLAKLDSIVLWPSCKQAIAAALKTSPSYDPYFGSVL